MPVSRTDWTLEMVHALPDDGNRYEVIDGELFVTPAPSGTHQRASSKLSLLLAPYAESLGIEVLYAPFAVRLAGRGEVQPDLVAFPLRSGEPVPDYINIDRMVLAVEILSPPQHALIGTASEPSISRWASPSIGSLTWRTG